MRFKASTFSPNKGMNTEYNKVASYRLERESLKAEFCNDKVSTITQDINSFDSEGDIPIKEDAMCDSISSDNKETNNFIDPLAPQVRIDADGNIVIDETSLTIQRDTSSEGRILRHVNEENGIISSSYSSFKPPKALPGSRWSEKETTLFYRALNTIGTDFYLMGLLFPHRTRSQLKAKFKREEKINHHLVNEALKNRRSYDLSALCPMSDEESVEVAPTCGDVSDTDNSKSIKRPPGRPPSLLKKRSRQTLASSDHVVEVIETVLAQTSHNSSPDEMTDHGSVI
ncbi:unnamed protein product, partial [Protopolystoma xenopodis]